MKPIFYKLIINTISVCIVAWMLSGIQLDNSFTAIWVAVALALFNTFLRPTLILLTIPLTKLTMGLFLLIINAGIVLLAGSIVPGFGVASFWTAFWFSILVSIVNFFLELPEKIRRGQVIINRTTEFFDPFSDEMPQHPDDEQEFEDAEIVDEDGGL